jgi:hypothetical protein
VMDFFFHGACSRLELLVLAAPDKRKIH